MAAARPSDDRVQSRGSDARPNGRAVMSTGSAAGVQSFSDITKPVHLSSRVLTPEVIKGTQTQFRQPASPAYQPTPHFI